MSREQKCLLAPKGLFSCEHIPSSFCSCSDFRLLSAVSDYLHQTAKRALHKCGAPEDQSFRTGLTQRRGMAEALQLVTRYQRGQSNMRHLAEAASQSKATGSAQLDLRDDGLHKQFISRIASLLYNLLLASTPSRLPVPACALSRCRPQAFAHHLYDAEDVAQSILVFEGSFAQPLLPPD